MPQEEAKEKPEKLKSEIELAAGASSEGSMSSKDQRTKGVGFIIEEAESFEFDGNSGRVLGGRGIRVQPGEHREVIGTRNWNWKLTIRVVVLVLLVGGAVTLLATLLPGAQAKNKTAVWAKNWASITEPRPQTSSSAGDSQTNREQFIDSLKRLDCSSDTSLAKVRDDLVDLVMGAPAHPGDTVYDMDLPKRSESLNKT